MPFRVGCVSSPPRMNPRLRWLSLASWLLALTAPLAAQAKLTVEATLVPPTAKPGDVVELVLKAKTPATYHAYGTKEETNLPVALKPKNQKLDGFELVGAAVVPEGTLVTKFGVDTHPLPEEFTVTQKLKVVAGFAGAEATITGALDYQLCDANMCLAPMKAKFEVKLPIAGAVAKPAPTQEPGKDKVPQAAAPKFVDQKLFLQIVPRIEPSPARAGEKVTLVLDVTVLDATRHAYGAKEETGLPVELDPAKLNTRGMKLEGASEVPPGEKFEKVEKFGTAEYRLGHQFEVKQRLRVPADAKPGSVKLDGVLDYQLCTENSCDEKAELAFTVDVVVEAGAARADSEIGGSEFDDVPDDNPLTGSLWALLLACIGGGLFALVMPCTYPMIPITFSFFTKQADARGGKVLSLALAYGAGIVGMFTIIGALAGLIGEQIAQFAAHWVTNLIIGGAFLAFGLSLLGLFTLQPPRFLVDAAGKTRGVGGLAGVLLMGATLVISSFTCTAPVVGLLLLPAVQSGDSTRPALGMAVFGLTMALPFVALALLPGKVRSLPRSGEWMNTLKVTLGCIELAAALKFFSNAEYVAQLNVLPRELFFAIWIVIFVALALYLAGLLPRATVGNGRRLGGFASFAFAGYCLYGALGYRLDFVMTALAPAYGASEIVRHPVFVDDYEAALAEAKKSGKLVLVNFTGFTCVNCRMVERGIMPDAQIAPLLEGSFVEARLHMDNAAVIEPAKWARHLQLRKDLIGGRITTPTYVSVDPTTERMLVEHVLSGDWLPGYRAFLEKSLQKTGRPLPAAK